MEVSQSAGTGGFQPLVYVGFVEEHRGKTMRVLWRNIVDFFCTVSPMLCLGRLGIPPASTEAPPVRLSSTKRADPRTRPSGATETSVLGRFQSARPTRCACKGCSSGAMTSISIRFDPFLPWRSPLRSRRQSSPVDTPGVSMHRCETRKGPGHPLKAICKEARSS